MVLDLESEEECFTNSLQRKLRSLKLEKEEAESEVGELKKQLGKMRVEQEKARDLRSC